MNRLTPEQRLQIVQFYFENKGSVRNTYRALRPFYGRQKRPSEQLIRLTMNRFRTTFSLIDNPHPQRRRTVRTEEAIAAVERSIEEDPNETIRHRAQELDLRPSTIWKILRKDLGEDDDEESGEDKCVTGRGRGKKVAAVGAKRSAASAANGGVPEKRGRPAGSKKSTPGRPGRKPAKEIDSGDDSQDKEHNDDINSSEDDNKKSKNKNDAEEDTGENSNEEDDLADGEESAA